MMRYRGPVRGPASAANQGLVEVEPGLDSDVVGFPGVGHNALGPKHAWLQRHPVRPEVNREVVNDRAKLMIHRLVERRLAHDPGILDSAKMAVMRLEAAYPERTFVSEWREILGQPPGTIRQLLTRRDEGMQRLRLSSPFLEGEGVSFVRDPNVRKRIWRLARKGAAAQRATHAGRQGFSAPT